MKFPEYREDQTTETKKPEADNPRRPFDWLSNYIRLDCFIVIVR